MESLRNMDTVQKIILGIVVASLIVAIIVLFKNSKAIKIEKPVEKEIVNEKEQEIIQDLPPRRSAQPQQSSGMLVMCFAPWCGHCKTLEPLWDELIQNFDGYNGIKIVKLEGEKNPQFMELHQVQGFPTIKYCPHGLDNPTGIVYNGDRSMDSIIDFLQQCGKIQQ